MLTIACVLKSGGIYDATWVARLRDGVARHLPLPHRFVCLSDVEVPCDRIPLEHDWPGWWSKLEAFKLPGPVLYFDLDTAIIGDLNVIGRLSVSSKFVMLRDFYAFDHCGSGVMAWGRDVSVLYDTFVSDPEEMMRKQRERMGDQAFIEEAFGGGNISRWQDWMPDQQIVSYKVHCRNGIPPNARVVCLHGHPKFTEMPEQDPVRRAWEMAA